MRTLLLRKNNALIFMSFEGKDPPVDLPDSIHILSEEDLDPLFDVDEIQPFTISEEGLQQIKDYNIKVT